MAALSKVPVAYVVPGSPSPRDKLRMEVAAREVGGWRATLTAGVLHEVRAYPVAREDVARANGLGQGGEVGLEGMVLARQAQPRPSP